MRRFQRARLSYKIFITLSVVLCGIFLLSSFTLHSYMESVLTMHLDDRLDKTVNGFRKSILTAVNLSIRNYLRSSADQEYNVFQNLNEKYLDGLISKEEAQHRAAEVVLATSIGYSGYTYIIDPHGTILVHPKPELIGSNVADHDFVKEQIKRRRGFLSYQWKNPDDDTEREKLLYMDYFAPWNWIISVTAYKDELYRLVSSEDLRKEVTSFSVMENGFPFLLDKSGKMLAHPHYTGNVLTDRSEESTFYRAILEKKQGRLKGSAPARNAESSSELIATFTTIDEYGWIIGAVADSAEFYNPLSILKKLFLNFFLLALIGSLLVAMLLSRSITRPLKTLLNSLESHATDFSAKGDAISAIPPSPLPLQEELNEIEEISNYFANYIQQLKNYNIRITELFEQQQQTAIDLSIFKEVFENSAEGIVITDSHGTIIQANPAYEKITGYTIAEAMGNNPRLLKSDRHPEEFYREMWETITKQGFWSGEIWNKRKNGEVYPEWLTISAIHNDTGEPTHYAAIFNDITTVVEQQERIQFLAYHDYLTELPNRLHLFDRMKQLLSSCKRHGGEVVLMILDLDNFKTINDSLGHDTGDLLLKKLVQRIRPLMRVEDSLCRMGGDEFVFVSENSLKGTETAMAVINRLKSCTEEPFVLQQHKVYLSFSIGIAIYPGDGATTEDLLKRADMALYSAKRTSGNSYHFFSEDLEVEVNRKMHYLSKIRSGLAAMEFLPYFQPKIELSTGKIYGVEALARWQAADGLVSPGDFIPISEQSGLIIPLADQIYRKAFAAIRELHRQNHPLTISVNLSPIQLQSDDFIENLLRIREESGLTTSFIELEVTESTLMHGIKKVGGLLRELGNFGFSLSIDDFGTGYSSLQYLKHLPLNTLKIDQSFVAGIGKNRDDETLVKTIILMARQFDLKIVAEGVEEELQEKFLEELGCDYGQGYYYGKPMDYEALLEWLGRHEV